MGTPKVGEEGGPQPLRPPNSGQGLKVWRGSRDSPPQSRDGLPKGAQGPQAPPLGGAGGGSFQGNWGEGGGSRVRGGSGAALGWGLLKWGGWGCRGGTGVQGGFWGFRRVLGCRAGFGCGLLCRGRWGAGRELGFRRGIGEGLFGVQEEDFGLKVLGCLEGIGEPDQGPPSCLGLSGSPSPGPWGPPSPGGPSPLIPARTDPPLWGRSRRGRWGGGGAFQRWGRRVPAFQRLGRAGKEEGPGGAIPGLRAVSVPPINYR